MKILTLAVLTMALGAASCMSRYQGTPGAYTHVSAETETETDMKSPMMFKEAGLPRGFPPPGPVGEVIVKEYPAYRVARTAGGGGSNEMFWPLFNHIKKNDIAMTAPVEMTYARDASSRKDEPLSMAFMYADPEMARGKTEGSVEVVDLPAETVLSVTLRGGYKKSFEKGILQLREWMENNPGKFEESGAPRFLGYNSPMVPPFLQIGEIQIPVKSGGGQAETASDARD